MSKRVLVTGGSGGIGRRLVELLTERGFEPVLLTVDLRDAALVADTVQTLSFDAAIHLAAVTHTHDPSLYYQVNVEGTRNLLSACQKKGRVRFVHMSSRAATPSSGAYGHSKWLSEALVRASTLDWVILQPAEVYGGSTKEAIHALYTFVTRYHVVPVVGSGNYTLAPVWVEDVLNATVRALTAPPCQTYNLSGPEVYTYKALVKKMASLFNTFALSVPVPLLVAHLLALLAKMIGSPMIVDDQIARLLSDKSSDSEGAQADLGFAPRSLTEGLRLAYLNHSL